MTRVELALLSELRTRTAAWIERARRTLRLAEMMANGPSPEHGAECCEDLAADLQREAEILRPLIRVAGTIEETKPRRRRRT